MERPTVEVGDGKYRVVKSHHELALVAGLNDKPIALEKPANFNTNEAKDDLYNWNSLRSQYLAEANNQIAGQYVDGSGFYPGWYWDPYAYGYTFIGGDPFYSPFGWGFYPFGWVRRLVRRPATTATTDIVVPAERGPASTAAQQAECMRVDSRAAASTEVVLRVVAGSMGAVEVTGKHLRPPDPASKVSSRPNLTFRGKTALFLAVRI